MRVLVRVLRYSGPLFSRRSGWFRIVHEVTNKAIVNCLLQHWQYRPYNIISTILVSRYTYDCGPRSLPVAAPTWAPFVWSTQCYPLAACSEVKLPTAATVWMTGDTMEQTQQTDYRRSSTHMATHWYDTHIHRSVHGPNVSVENFRKSVEISPEPKAETSSNKSMLWLWDVTIFVFDR